MIKQLRDTLVFAGLVAGIGFAVPAQAAGGPVLLHLTLERKTETADASGTAHVTWTPIEAGQNAVHPGDVLRCDVHAQNTGAVPVTGLAVTQPVSSGTVYVASSAENGLGQGVSVVYSLDGRQFSARPQQTEIGKDGIARVHPASPEAYAALRWRFSVLPAHAAKDVVYLVKVR